MTRQPDPDEIAAALRALQYLAQNPDAVTDPLGRAVAQAYKRARKHRRILAARARPKDTKTAPASPHPCYMCAQDFEPRAPTQMLCATCTAINAQHRGRRADLRGRRAIVTGARIKLGYHTALKLLRDGAHVIATTRFPANAAARYATEPDFSEWRSRLSLHGLDLLNPRAIQAFANHITSLKDGLNILINNAAQTIRRPPEYYRTLLSGETHPALPPAARELIAEPASADPPESSPPALRAFDAKAHTWLLPLEKVTTLELAEVMVVNAMAPFMLCSLLEPMLRQSPFPDRYIVNVSSAEGAFSRDNKTGQHPHTNMAKAALNMLTRTSADLFAKSGIQMNSVDPGWITHMVAVDPASQNEDSNFAPPLDAIDGAARIYDPIIRGIEGHPVHGLLLRDFHSVSW